MDERWEGPPSAQGPEHADEEGRSSTSAASAVHSVTRTENLALVGGLLQGAHGTVGPVVINVVAAHEPEPELSPHHEHHSFFANLRSKEGITLLTLILGLFNGGLTLGNTVIQAHEPVGPTTPAVVLVREVRPGEIDAHASGPDPDEGSPDHDAVTPLPDAMEGVLREATDEELRALAEANGVPWTDDRDDVIEHLLRPLAERVAAAGSS